MPMGRSQAGILSDIVIDTDLILDEYAVKGVNYSFKEAAGFTNLFNRLENDFRPLRLSILHPTNYIDFSENPAGCIKGKDADDAYITLTARDNAVGLVEIARIQGAAEPYFGIGLEGIAIRTVKITKAFNSDIFAVAGTNKKIEILAASADRVILAVKMVLDAKFVGPSLTALDIDIANQVGVDEDDIIDAAANMVSDDVGEVYKNKGVLWNASTKPAFLNNVGLGVDVNSVGCNLEDMTAGSITIYYTYLDIP